MEETSIKKAALILAVSKYSTIFLNLFFTTILARLLSPNDYGIVAVTTVFTTFFSLFADMGIGAGIVQNKELTEKDVNCIFSFSIKLGIILCIIFSLFSYPLSLFYEDSVYILVGILLSVSLLFNTFNMVPNALLLKQKEFLRVGIRTVVVCILTGIIGILLALCGLKYYALIIQAILNSFFTFVWNFVSTKPRITFRINKESMDKTKKYSSFIFAFNIINYFSRNSDNLLISKFMGAANLGYYDKAYKLMCYPTQNLTHVITPVIHPILSEHQNEKEYIYKKYMKIIKILSLLGIFIMTFCFFASDEIIRIMFGDRWEDSIPCFKFLSVSIWAQMITSSSGSVFQSLGDSKCLFISGTINSVFTIGAIILGILEGNIVAVSRNVGIIYILHFISTYIILIRFSFKGKIINFLQFLLPDFFIILVMFLVGFGTDLLFKIVMIRHILLKCVIRGSIMLPFFILLLIMTRQYKYLMVIKHKNRKG